MLEGETQLLLIILFALLLGAILWIVRLEIRLHRLVGGSDKKSLESNIVGLKKTVNDFLEFKTHVHQHLESVEGRLKKGIRHVDTVRFDPFKGSSSGGSQSFATAFLNENGDGVVISTIRSRDQVGVFSKPIVGGTSTYELTDEERKVIESFKNT